MTTGKLYEKVAIKLSDAQLLTLGKELAELEGERAKVEEEKSEALNTFNAKLKTFDAKIAEKAEQINGREKHEDIEVREEPDDGRNVVVTVRADNGQVIKQRDMTLNEMAEANMRRQGVSEDGKVTTINKGRRKGKAAAAIDEDSDETQSEATE